MVLDYEKFTIITLSNVVWDGDGKGRGKVGLKSLNPSPPHHLCEMGKTHLGRSEEERVK